MKEIDNIVKKVLLESLNEKAEEITNKIQDKISENQKIMFSVILPTQQGVKEPGTIGPALNPTSVMVKKPKFILSETEEHQIDYVLGKITLTDFNPTGVNNTFKDIMIHMRPNINIIQSKLNKMLVLDTEDPTSIVVKTTKAE